MTTVYMYNENSLFLLLSTPGNIAGSLYKNFKRIISWPPGHLFLLEIMDII